ncbi:MAG: hypothetical protein ACFCUU_18425 [Cyclobacteriaceae bacterium]
MTTSAIITMIVVQLSVTLITGYFFWKVLKLAPSKKNGKEAEEH